MFNTKLKKIILHILRDKGGLHAYGIIKAFNEYTLGYYKPSTGALYPALKSLVEEGMVEEALVDGRKIYRLTDKGRIAISLDTPLQEHIKRVIAKDAPYRELWNIGKTIFSNWDKLDNSRREKVKMLVNEFEIRIREVIEGG
ncbi:TPA: PadR family transcriptional regulator [Candidatus Geothermarchaeota archaeon]|nr:PadR family transcriptional regulator [Candidatus Geothermarchaeota archaeon]HIQ12856.1 PadR family transcriptional regulator [Thermoprotei archaeon]